MQAQYILEVRKEILLYLEKASATASPSTHTQDAVHAPLAQCSKAG